MIYWTCVAWSHLKLCREEGARAGKPSLAWERDTPKWQTSFYRNPAILMESIWKPWQKFMHSAAHLQIKMRGRIDPQQPCAVQCPNRALAPNDAKPLGTPLRGNRLRFTIPKFNWMRPGLCFRLLLLPILFGMEWLSKLVCFSMIHIQTILSIWW